MDSASEQAGQGSGRPTADDLVAVVIVACAARALYFAMGLSFDASPLTSYMQFLDVELLADDLWRSLWFYHANPPILNLVSGLAIQWFDDGAPVALALLFHGMGLVMLLGTFALVLRHAGNRLLAHLVTASLAFSPAFVLYENWLMYTFPAATLLVMATYALSRYLDVRRTGWALALAAVLGLLVLTRSVFHLFWMLGIAGVLLFLLAGHRRQLLIAFALPVALCVGWYGKNLYLVGHFGASSWMGLGLTNITLLFHDREVLRPLVDDGVLSEFALLSRYLDTPRLFETGSRPPTGIPALDQARTSTGQYNYNHWRIVEASEAYTRDSLRIAARFPDQYARGVWMANQLFFSPTSMNLYFSERNRAAAGPFERAYNVIVFGADPSGRSIEQPHFGFGGQYFLEVNPSLRLALLWAAALIYGMARFFDWCRRGAPRDSRSTGAIVHAFVASTMLYVQLVGTGLELAENYRYRFLVEALFLFTLACAAMDAWRLAGRHLLGQARRAPAP